MSRELDAKMAELMGWQPRNTKPIKIWIHPDGNTRTAPDPFSTDIAAALPLLDDETDVSMEKAGAGWHILIVRTMSEGHGDTLPLAICRAKLNAVEEQNE